MTTIKNVGNNRAIINDDGDMPDDDETTTLFPGEKKQSSDDGNNKSIYYSSFGRNSIIAVVVLYLLLVAVAVVVHGSFSTRLEKRTSSLSSSLSSSSSNTDSTMSLLQYSTSERPNCSKQNGPCKDSSYCCDGHMCLSRKRGPNYCTDEYCLTKWSACYKDRECCEGMRCGLWAIRLCVDK